MDFCPCGTYLLSESDMVSRRPNKQIRYFWEISCQLPNIFFTIVEKLFHYGVIVKSDCDSHGPWWAVDVTCEWHLCWKVIHAAGNREGKGKGSHSSPRRETLNFKRWTDCNTWHISFQYVHFSMQFFPKWKSGRSKQLRQLTPDHSGFISTPTHLLLQTIWSKSLKSHPSIQQNTLLFNVMFKLWESVW